MVRSYRRRKKVLFALILALIIVLVMLVIGEVAMRALVAWRLRGDLSDTVGPAIVDPDREIGMGELIMPDDHPDIVFTMRPGTQARLVGAPVRINELGMRDDQPLQPGPDETLVRIIGLGDSHMFGWGVEHEATFLALLEASLQRMARPDVVVDAVNMAVPGYNAVQEVALFEQRGLALDPDVVIVQYCLNDNVLPAFLTRRVSVFDLRRLYLLDAGAWLGAQFRGDAPAVAGLIATSIGLKDPPGQPYEMDPDVVPAVYQHLLGWENLARAYRRLKELCDERGIALYIMLPSELPHEPFKWGQNDPQKIPHYDKVRGLCSELGIPVIDPFPDVRAFLEEHGWQSIDLVVSMEDGHPGPMKHNLFAQRLLTELEPLMQREGWVEPGMLEEELGRLRAMNEELAARHEKRPYTPPDPLLD